MKNPESTAQTLTCPAFHLPLTGRLLRLLLLLSLCLTGLAFAPPASALDPWTTVDLFQYRANSSTEGRALASDSAGNLYVAAFGQDPSGYSRWLVRMSADGGLSWTLVDDYSLGGSAWPNAIASDGAGNMIVVGLSTPPSQGQAHLIVRKGNASGFQTILDYQHGSLGAVAAVANGVAVDSAGNIFVSGHGHDGTNYKSLVLKRAVGGAWSLIDEFQLQVGQNTFGRAIAADASGRVFVVGEAYSKVGSKRSAIVSAKAFVRSGSASGGFSTVDVHQLASNKNTMAKGVGIDASGAVLLTGVATDAANTRHLFVRRSANGAASSFANIDLYQGAPGKNASGLAIAVDSSGIALVAGSAIDASNVAHAIVRRISASGAVLSDDFQIVGGLGTGYNGVYINPVSGIAYCTGTGADGAVNSATLVVRKL